MSANNVLLGSDAQVKANGHKPLPPQIKTPAWRFHKDFLEGKVFLTDDELDDADSKGWVDHPGKARLLQGHEKIWEAQQLLEAKKPIQEKSNKNIIEAIAAEIEAKYKKDYEDAKTPVGSHLCTLCGKSFSTLRALNMHGIAAHKNKIRRDD